MGTTSQLPAKLNYHGSHAQQRKGYLPQESPIQAYRSILGEAVRCRYHQEGRRCSSRRRPGRKARTAMTRRPTTQCPRSLSRSRWPRRRFTCRRSREGKPVAVRGVRDGGWVEWVGWWCRVREISRAYFKHYHVRVCASTASLCVSRVGRGCRVSVCGVWSPKFA